MADAAVKGRGISRPDTDVAAGGIDAPDAPEPAVIPRTDGSVVVDFAGARPAPGPDLAFDADLTPLFTEDALSRLGSTIVNLVDEDERSRAEWRKTYARGLELLGLKYEERTEPWENACGAFHPMLLESVIRFNAQAMMDIFPGAGPVKTQIVGDVTDEVEQQALRVQRDLNWLTTRRIKGYRLETDMMLFNLPLAGTAFRKFGFDERRQVPWAEYVLPEHVVMPYAAASLDTAERYTVILPKTANWIKSRMASGFFRKIEIGQAAIRTSEIEQKRDEIEGRHNTNFFEDRIHRLYETHIEWFFEEDPLPGDNAVHPYVVTVDRDTMRVLAIRRDWRDGDITMERQRTLIQHKYMPGFGPYGVGLINILGGLTESATSILRQLIDAGTLSNLPAGYKTKQARVKDDSTPIGPGEWRDVDVGMGSLRDAFYALPYKEPSTVLAALLGQVVDEGRRIGSVADMKITDMTGQNMPVGTTLAIIERSMKVMSAVQQRLYESFTQELTTIAEIVHDFMGAIPYPFRLKAREQGATREQDYDDRVDVVPVADPNASTMAQRILVMQSIIQLTQQQPNIYNLKNVHRDMITVLGSDKAEFYIPPDEQVLPRDPITENMDILTGKPVRVGPAQDHKAHITVHMAAAEDPKIVQMLTNNPAAPQIMAAANAHILEHLAWQYRADIEAELGVPLPPPDQPLPDDVEYQVSRLVAAAAEKLLSRDKAEAQQKEILDKLQDPVIQNEMRALDIKERAEDTKRMRVLADIDAEGADRAKDILLEIFKQMSETERAVLSAEIQKGAQADETQLRTAEIASDLGQGMMGKIADLLTARLKADSDKRRAGAQ